MENPCPQIGIKLRMENLGGTPGLSWIPRVKPIFYKYLKLLDLLNIFLYIKIDDIY
jgi:hypothetical protein